MVMKKRMHSPTQDRAIDEPLLPLHVVSPTVPPHMRSISSDSDESSSRDSWQARTKSDDSLPMWSANPQAPSEDTLSTASSDSGSSGVYRFKAPLFMIGFVLVGIAALVTSKNTLGRATREVHRLEQRRLEMAEMLSRSRQDIQSLTREISAMDAMIQQKQGLDARASNANNVREKALQEMAHLQDRLKEDGELASSLKEMVQKMSRSQVEQKYGPGPHRVEMELVFPDGKLGPDTFVVELASLDLMPHSVHTFLEMVSTGLLDGCSFILNALHVLKAAPLPYDGTSAAEKARQFSSHGLESVAFKEYNDKYPHTQYTIGFAADGSPSFYINTEDNTEIHVGDPCFGTIVSGFHTIHRLESAPTRNGIWFEKRIGIKRARILPK